MSIAHSIMLLVTLLFVLTTRGVNLDFHSPIRNGIRAGFVSPGSLPMRRISSAFLSQDHSDVERTLDPTSELAKLRMSWHNLPPSRDSIQSAPASTPRVLRAWNSPPASSLNRYRGMWDAEETQD